MGYETGTDLGVAFDGSIVPSGVSGILTNISVSEIFSNICIENVVLANQSAEPIDIIIGEYCIEH